MAVGTFPVPVPSHVPEDAYGPNLAELRRTTSWVSDHLGLTHDMGYHIGATYLISEESVGVLRAAIAREAVRIGGASASLWIEGRLTQAAAEVQAAASEPGEFADVFEERVDSLLESLAHLPTVSVRERARTYLQRWLIR